MGKNRNKIGISFNDWLIIDTFKESWDTKYLLENEKTKEQIAVSCRLVSKWFKNPETFDIEKCRSYYGSFHRTKNAPLIIKPKFTSVEDEIKYCMHRIRYVKKCEECLRFNENCDTLAKLSGVKND